LVVAAVVAVHPARRRRPTATEDDGVASSGEFV